MKLSCEQYGRSYQTLRIRLERDEGLGSGTRFVDEKEFGDIYNCRSQKVELLKYYF